MSREALKNLIELVPEDDVDTLWRVVVKFIPEDDALPDEVEAIQKADDSIMEFGTVSHADIDWD